MTNFWKKSDLLKVKTPELFLSTFLERRDDFTHTISISSPYHTYYVFYTKKCKICFEARPPKKSKKRDFHSDIFINFFNTE